MRIETFATLAVIGIMALASVAAAHPPEQGDPVPSRKAFLVDAAEEVVLTDNASHAVQGSIVFELYSQAIWPYACAYGCYAYEEGSYVGPDFEVNTSAPIDGIIRVAWQWQGNGLSLWRPGPHDTVGMVDISIGAECYGGSASVPLEGPEGLAEFPLQIASESGGCHDHAHGHDNTTAHHSLWAHDLRLSVGAYMWPQDPFTSSAFGEELLVKIDTGGGSFLAIPEIVPEPEVVEEAAAIEPVNATAANATPAAAQQSAEEAAEPVLTVPGAGAWAVIAAASMGLAASRYRYRRG